MVRLRWVEKQLKFILYISLLLLFLGGCSSQTDDVSELDNVVRMEQIKPYLDQWDNNKSKINRLSEIEGDLLMLIKALSMQTNLDTLPDEMRTEVNLVQHSAVEKKTNTLSNTGVIEEDIASMYGVKLGSYLKQQSASNTVVKLKQSYPNIFNVFQYRVQTESKSNTQLYKLIAGPFKNKQDAYYFCKIISRINLSCKLSPFEGVII